jgi:NADH:ubiquinone oxidoreductase subunit 6 (subunit J)
MVYVALFLIVALLEIFSAILVFVFRNILHTVLVLSFLFILNSAVFLILSEPLLALLQLFIMVGGVSTYIFVGVSSPSYSKFKSTDYRAFVVIYLLIFILFSARITQANPIVAEQNRVSAQMISQSLASNAGFLYILAIMLFGTGLGSIILIRKLGAVK